MRSRLPEPPGWYVISLRPRGGHEALRRAAARAGAGLIALSPWALVPREDAAARAALAAALAADRVLFTSPAAVRAAARLQPLRPAPAQAWCAVGAGTAAALRRAGVAGVHAPARMDSEGVLALPALHGIGGGTVGLVTAPGGRGAIGPALIARGAQVRRADVYAREPAGLSPRAVAALAALDRPAALALSSGEALQRVLAMLPEAPAAKLRRAQVLAASARLADLARSCGFTDVAQAAGPQPRALLATARMAVE